MGSIKLIRTAKAGYLILAALFCAMGIAMLASPDSSAQMLGWGSGVALAAFGIVRIIGFFSRDSYCLAFQNDPALGALAIALGMVLIFRRGVAANTLCLVHGNNLTINLNTLLSKSFNYLSSTNRTVELASY